MQENEDMSIEEGVDPVREKYQTQAEQMFWLDEIESARKEREQYDKQATETIKRFSDQRDNKDSGSYFNIFYANTELKLGALYARTPKPDIKRRFNDADDDVSRVASNILQRNITYELDQNNFDATFKQILFDRLVPGFGVGWLRFEEEETEQVFDANGMPMPSMPEQLAAIDYVSWSDFVYAPCRVWSECRWVARRIPMTRSAVNARFGESVDPDVVTNLNFAASRRDTDQKNKLGPRNQTSKTVDVYEVWDKERRLVFWVTDGADVPLDVREDTNEFPDFFPTPLPPLGRYDTSNTLPISDYRLSQDQYRELDDLNNRCSKLTQALKLQWVYESSNLELAELYSTGSEFQGIPVKNWAQLQTEKGGIRGAIEFVPLDEIAATYQKLSMARDVVKNQIYEIEGISDILRGAATPYETAAATSTKAAYASSRIGIAQHDVARYIERLLSLKAHMICRFYTPQTILARCGMPPPADQQYIGPALQLLKDEQMRGFRLDVSVDSIQLPNWDQEKRERNELIQAVTALMAQGLPAVQQNPALAPMLLTLIKFGVAGYKGAKDIEGMLDSHLQGLMQAQSQAQTQPKPPSPAEIKAQLEQQRIQAGLQEVQMQEETKRIIAQQNAMIEAQSQRLQEIELMLKRQKAEADHSRDIARLQIDATNKAHSTASNVTAIVTPPPV